MYIQRIHLGSSTNLLYSSLLDLPILVFISKYIEVIHLLRDEIYMKYERKVSIIIAFNSITISAFVQFDAS